MMQSKNTASLVFILMKLMDVFYRSLVFVPFNWNVRRRNPEPRVFQNCQIAGFPIAKSQVQLAIPETECGIVEMRIGIGVSRR